MKDMKKVVRIHTTDSLYQLCKKIEKMLDLELKWQKAFGKKIDAFRDEILAQLEEFRKEMHTIWRA